MADITVIGGINIDIEGKPDGNLSTDRNRRLPRGSYRHVRSYDRLYTLFTH